MVRAQPIRNWITRRRVLGLGFGGLVLAALGSRRAGAQVVDRSIRANHRWVCASGDCTPYIYDPIEGDPSYVSLDGTVRGIPPGTPWYDLPDDWYCPDCGEAKIFFIPLDR